MKRFPQHELRDPIPEKAETDRMVEPLPGISVLGDYESSEHSSTESTETLSDSTSEKSSSLTSKPDNPDLMLDVPSTNLSDGSRKSGDLPMGVGNDVKRAQGSAVPIVSKAICNSFARSGQCRRGDRCDYAHIVSS